MLRPQKILARATPAPLKRILRRCEAVLKSYPYQCSVCQRRVGEFRSLRKTLPGLIESWEKHAFDVQLFAQAETLNIWQYSCPYCRASDRSRLYALFIRSQARNFKPHEKRSFLDIAPDRPLRKMIGELGCFDYRSADLDRADVDDRIDITNMTIYGPSTFDCFLCSHVLEHVPNDRLALRELFRVLKPGGWGIVMAPISLSLLATIEDIHLNDPAERIRRFGQDDHLRLYARQDFIQKLSEPGFAVDQLGMTFFGPDVLFRHGITQSSVLYVCRKN
jgi:SAM-dependent methyltransferase